MNDESTRDPEGEGIDVEKLRESGLRDKSYEELIKEFEASCRHLALCEHVGQVDISERRWNRVLRIEIHRRIYDMDTEFMLVHQEPDGEGRNVHYRDDVYSLILEMVYDYVDDMDRLCDFLQTEYEERSADE